MQISDELICYEHCDFAAKDQSHPTLNYHSVTAFAMSLYYETAPFLITSGTGDSLKSRVFSAGPTKTPTTQIFALASETSKWSPVLAEVIERAQLLQSTSKVCSRVKRFPQKAAD